MAVELGSANLTIEQFYAVVHDGLSVRLDSSVEPRYQGAAEEVRVAASTLPEALLALCMFLNSDNSTTYGYLQELVGVVNGRGLPLHSAAAA